MNAGQTCSLGIVSIGLLACFWNTAESFNARSIQGSAWRNSRTRLWIEAGGSQKPYEVYDYNPSSSVGYDYPTSSSVGYDYPTSSYEPSYMTGNQYGTSPVESMVPTTTSYAAPSNGMNKAQGNEWDAARQAAHDNWVVQQSAKKRYLAEQAASNAAIQAKGHMAEAEEASLRRNREYEVVRTFASEAQSYAGTVQKLSSHKASLESAVQQAARRAVEVEANMAEAKKRKAEEDRIAQAKEQALAESLAEFKKLIQLQEDATKEREEHEWRTINIISKRYDEVVTNVMRSKGMAMTIMEEVESSKAPNTELLEQVLDIAARAAAICSKAESDAEASRREAKNAADERTALLEKCGELNKKGAESEAERKKLVEEAAIHKTVVDKLELQIKKQDLANKKSENELARVKVSVIAAQGVKDNLNRDKERFTKEVDLQKLKMVELSAKNQELDGRSSNIAAVKKQLAEQLARASENSETSNQKFGIQITKMEEDLRKLEAQMQEKKKALSAAESELVHVQSSLEKVNSAKKYADEESARIFQAMNLQKKRMAELTAANQKLEARMATASFSEMG